MPPSNHAAHRAGSPGPTLELQQEALAAVQQHPLCLEAKTFLFCEPVIMQEAKSMIQGFRISDEIKAAVAEELKAVEEVILVSFWTSTTKPQPLSGGGRTFNFILHPEPLRVIQAFTGTWRS